MSDDNEKTVIAGDTTFKGKITEAQNMPPSLVMIMGPISQMGKQWFLNKPGLSVGRGPDCDIFIDDKSVSKVHCQLFVVDQKVNLQDVGSTNGTELGGKKITPQQTYPLRNNDQVKMGNVLFKFLEKGNIESIAQQQVMDKSEIDSLTQIYNKGAYLNKIEEYFKKSRSADIPLSLVVFDLDNFKRVNDTHGHAAGDYVLKEMSAIIKSGVIRQNDFFARYGGEEFVLLMFNCPLKRAVEVAERIRSTIDQHEFMWQDVRLEVTTSMGVATLESDMASSHLLFEKADQACYVSKKSGKNKVSTL